MFDQPNQINSAEQHILIIDDDQSVRYILTKILESANYKVTSSETGTDALFLLLESKQNFDLITLDLELGDMTGEEFLNKLEVQAKSTFENTCFLPPILIVTGDPYSTSIIYSHKFVKGCLAKPFSMKEILTEVEKFVKKGPDRNITPASSKKRINAA